MVFPRQPAGKSVRAAAAAVTVLAVAVLGAPALGATAPPRPEPGSDRPAMPAAPVVAPPAPPEPTAGKPLPEKQGRVATDADLTFAEAAGDGLTAAAATPTGKVGLRALVVALDEDDWGLSTWKATLDRVGAAYDVIHTRSQPLTGETLAQADGTGRYNAILLTDGMLLYQGADGSYVSGLTPDEWNLLWAYERDFGVRQATLYSSYGTWPEDYCMRGRQEGGVGSQPITATLTSTGSAVMDHLRAGAQIPIQDSYVYRNELAAGCDGQAVLTSGSDVLGVRTTSTDGRERMALTFTSNQYLVQADLLVYGLFRWASRGLFFGEQRHYLNVDVDDWFNSSDELLVTGEINSDPGFRMSAHDAYNTMLRQRDLRTRYPLASALKMKLAYNAADADPSAGSRCSPNGGTAQLTATSRCIRAEFEWLNHTYTHADMNVSDYPTSYSEIKANYDVGRQLGFNPTAQVVKTGEYSGLGVYHPDPDNDVDPPTDFGLGASNPELLRAAKDLGVRYLHGNMSFASHRPSCFNCSVVHPMEPSVSIVPDWPTNIAYFSTTPEQETYFYNSYYGPDGKFPYWPTDLTYSQILDAEASQALTHLATGSIYSHTMHIGNLRDYGGGRTLVTDWADRLLQRYSAYYRVPLLNPAWQSLAQYTTDRNRHFAGLGAGVRATYDPAARTVTVVSPSAGKVTVTGAKGTGSTQYGSEVSTPVTYQAGSPVSLTASPLP